MNDVKKCGNTTLIFNSNNVTQSDKQQALESIAKLKRYYDVENAVVNINNEVIKCVLEQQ